MQYILSEKEYKELIHKDRIRIPLDNFLESVNKMIGKQSFNPLMVEVDRYKFETELKTLQIKLDI